MTSIARWLHRTALSTGVALFVLGTIGMAFGSTAECNAQVRALGTGLFFLDPGETLCPDVTCDDPQQACFGQAQYPEGEGQPYLYLCECPNSEMVPCLTFMHKSDPGDFFFNGITCLEQGCQTTCEEPYSQFWQASCSCP